MDAFAFFFTGMLDKSWLAAITVLVSLKYNELIKSFVDQAAVYCAIMRKREDLAQTPFGAWLVERDKTLWGPQLQMNGIVQHRPKRVTNRRCLEHCPSEGIWQKSRYESTSKRYENRYSQG